MSISAWHICVWVVFPFSSVQLCTLSLNYSKWEAPPVIFNSFHILEISFKLSSGSPKDFLMLCWLYSIFNLGPCLGSLPSWKTHYPNPRCLAVICHLLHSVFHLSSQVHLLTLRGLQKHNITTSELQSRDVVTRVTTCVWYLPDITLFGTERVQF